MASATFYAQINFHAVALFDSVPSGQIGFGAKGDGLYAKTSSLESRLLMVADIGVNVAAFSHTHDYDNYGYWGCKVGSTTDNINSRATVEYYAGTGISLTISNPGQNLSRVSISIGDDVVRKTGTPSLYLIPIFSNSNTVTVDDKLYYNWTTKVLSIGGAGDDLSATLRLNCDSATLSKTNILEAYRRSNGNAIERYCNILSIRAWGGNSSYNYANTGEILFSADEDFGSDNKGTSYVLKTHTSGTSGAMAVRHQITGTGLSQIWGGLMVGDLNDPTSVLHSAGSVAFPITSTAGNLTLNNSHFTVIITATAIITLPAASTCPGRIYVLVNRTSTGKSISSYTTFNGTSTSIGSYGSLFIQSNGSIWYQIK